MENSETGMSTSNSSGSKFEVFLSFRGPDTRCGFTNTLYTALKDAGIHVFFDDEELRPGEIISDELLQGINDSKLYIPIFSRSYASSHWCLRELAKMVENTSKSKDGNKKVILPIFYNVKSNDVKLKTLLYRDDIEKLEKEEEGGKKKFRSEDVEAWRQALQKVGRTKGLELHKFPGDGDLSKAVVKEVVKRLQTKQRRVTKDLVGMEDRIADINNLLDINSGRVLLIGIYGMSGIGKSTLANIIYNQLCPHFGNYCGFLDNISEKAKTEGLDKLQQKLWSGISDSKVAHNIHNNDHGITTIGRTICNKKVLVLLDDVNKGNQIEELIGMNSLYPGTRILVTTRDKRVLDIRGFEYEIKDYKLEGLNNEDALQLFSRHAFNDTSPPADYCTLSEGIVATAGGLPLALQAIGSLLFRKKKKIWEEMLGRLMKTPNTDVLGKLRITYDALESNQKYIFLDVACFFIGENKTNPFYVWEDCGFSPEYAIDVLIDKCMIEILDDDSFWMHDQFRDLGRAIANPEDPQDPERCTRLWAKDNILCELRSKEDKRSVQALDLRLGFWIQPPITVTAEQIERFPCLRFLWLHHVTCQGNFTGCLSQLKWISLHKHPNSPVLRIPEHHPRFEATNLHLENVVVANLSGLGFTEDKVNSLIKGANKLKVLNLQEERFLYRTPTFSKESVLEKLTISQCSSMMEVDRSIKKLTRLTDLSIESCWALEKLPKQIGRLQNLQHLSLMNCKGLSELPDSICKLELLTMLDVSCTSITRLSDSIGRLPSLSSLNVSYTPIVKMPRTMSKLRRLQTLDLDPCNNIQELPKLPKNLTTLRLRSSSLQTIPNFSNLTNLVELLLSDGSDAPESKSKSNIIQGCELHWIGRLSKLSKQHLCLLNVRAPSTELGSLSLKELTLNGLDLQTLERLPSKLTVLQLCHTRVKQLYLKGLHQLKNLTVHSCEVLEKLSISSSLRKLREAKLSYCTELVDVQFFGVLKSLERLRIEHCIPFKRLVCLPEEPGCNELQAPKLTYGVSSSLKKLQEFRLSSCPQLQEIQFISRLKSLEVFSVEGCCSLERLGGLSNLKNLKQLYIEDCESLKVVEGIDELELLHSLEVNDCESMELIIDAFKSKIPKECKIEIENCGKLLDTVPYGSSITWESYIGKILNRPTQGSDSKTETGDRLLKMVLLLSICRSSMFLLLYMLSISALF